MGSDAISNAYICAFVKNSSKKKRGNQMAKFEMQNKLDFNREQSLIKVSNKGYIAETDHDCGVIGPSDPKGIAGGQKRGSSSRSDRRDEHEIPPMHGTNGSEAISWRSSSISGKSGRNNLCSDYFGRRSISSASGSWSSSCSEEDRDKGCLDDWEAVADALSPSSRQSLGLGKHNESGLFMSRNGSQTVSRSHCCRGKNQAWSPDDVFRPRSLPHISRQQKSMIQVSVNNVSRGTRVLSWQIPVVQKQQQPSVCPICCEDLDVTDSSFLPCSCGFILCLFCHKRILEVDGRCPGCRKEYGSRNDGAGSSPDTPLASHRIR